MDYKDKNDFSNVQVGDEVWSPLYGDGCVSNVRFAKNGTVNEICVDFPYHFQYYSLDKINTNINDNLDEYEYMYPAIYWQKPDWWQDNKFPTKKRWRAEFNQLYYIVDEYGNIQLHYDQHEGLHEARFNVGNYFKTSDNAKASNIYKAFHPEEEYNV